jgi:Ethanolamine utilization protein EutJ (predicted chaperonin)
MLALWVLPSTLRIGYAVTATPPGVVVIGAAVAVALLSSVWIAVGEGYDSPRGAAEV